MPKFLKKLFNQKIKTLTFLVLTLLIVSSVQAQSEPTESTESTESTAPAPAVTSPIFDDKLLLEGYSNSYTKEPKEIIIAMIQDDTLDDYKMAAAVRVFRNKYSNELFVREKKAIEKILLRRLNKTNSIFVEVEVMLTLINFDRYKYFSSMMPLLIEKLDHYNRSVNDIAFDGMNELLNNQNRGREARIVFNVLRKNLFLSRKRLSNMKEPDNRLKQKISLIRWSIKILGTEELRRLPKEIIPLL